MLKRISALVAVLSIALAVLIAPASYAATADDFVNPRDGVCDLGAAGLGHGSASDPFLISTPKQLAEVHDCNQRTSVITNAVGNGTQVTFTSDNTYGVGQVIDVRDVDPASFNVESARVIAADATTFTIAGTSTDSYISGGSTRDNHTYFSIESDIDLSGGTESWNNVDTASITNVVGDGSTVTFTANNTFEVGQTILIQEVAPSTLSLGWVTVSSADSTSFTVSSSVTDTYLSGGRADSSGWSPITGPDGTLRNTTIWGNDHTISGLRIAREANDTALIGKATDFVVTDLHLTDFRVQAIAGSNQVSNTGGLIGYGNNGRIERVDASGTVMGRFRNVGLIGGYLSATVLSDITTEGYVGARRLYPVQHYSWTDYASNFGGIAGFHDGEGRNLSSTATIDGILTNAGIYTDEIETVMFVGVLFGYGEGNYTDLYANGFASGSYSVGGLMGGMCCGTVTNAHSAGEVLGYGRGNSREIRFVGGLFGNWDCCGVVRDSYSEAKVSVLNESVTVSVNAVGGFAGSHNCCGAFFDVYSTGDVSVTTTPQRPANGVGGFVGDFNCCDLMESVWSSGDVTVNYGSSVGGLIGNVSSSAAALHNSYSTGDVTTSYDGVAAAGGLIGRVEHDLDVTGSWATGNVTVTPVTEGSKATTVGGLVGLVARGPLRVADSFYRGTLTANDRMGGFVGWLDSDLSEFRSSYTAAVINHDADAKEIDPFAQGNVIDLVKTSTFDQETTGGQTSVAGTTGNSTAAMKTRATFTELGWEFTDQGGLWSIDPAVNEGYPHLTYPTTLALPAATMTWAPVTKVAVNTTSPSALATSNSSGAITYAVTAAGTTGCTVNATTGALKFSAAGQCTITATAAADANFSASSVSVTFTVTPADCAGAALGTVSFSRGKSQLDPATRKQVNRIVQQITAKGCKSVVITGFSAEGRAGLAKARAFTVKNAVFARLNSKGVTVRFATKWIAKASAVSKVSAVGKNQ